MPGKRKQYITKFSPEVIKKAHSTFYKGLKKEKQLIASNFNVWFKDKTSLRLDNENEFYAEYQKDIARASLRCQYRYNDSYDVSSQ